MAVQCCTQNIGYCWVKHDEAIIILLLSFNILQEIKLKFKFDCKCMFWFDSDIFVFVSIET